MFPGSRLVDAQLGMLAALPVDDEGSCELIRNLPFARAREAKTTRPYHWSAEKWTYIL